MKKIFAVIALLTCSVSVQAAMPWWCTWLPNNPLCVVAPPPNEAPVADFSYTLQNLNVLVNSESSDSDGTVIAWDWDWGDGNTAQGETSSHIYTNSGTHTVTLTVTDDDGATDQFSKDVTVTEPVPLPPPPQTVQPDPASSLTVDNLVVQLLDTNQQYFDNGKIRFSVVAKSGYDQTMVSNLTDMTATVQLKEIGTTNPVSLSDIVLVEDNVYTADLGPYLDQLGDGYYKMWIGNPSVSSAGSVGIKIVDTDGLPLPPPPPVPVVGTKVSGVISQDTTWDLTGSPYLLVNDVFIDAVLTIDPGVEVRSIDFDTVFNLVLEPESSFNAIGSENEKIIFNYVRIDSSVQSGSADVPYINISFAEMNNVLILDIIKAQYARIHITDSILDNCGGLFLNGGSNTSFNFERNIINKFTGQFTMYYSSVMTFTNNAFINSVPLTSGSSSIILRNNSFLQYDNPAIQVSNRSSAVIDAVENHWGTTDINIIETMIHDRNDDSSLSMFIPFEPFLTAPHPDTPDPTPYLQ